MCRPTLPCWPELSTKLWKQKRRGSKILSAPIPSFRPSHCPQIRISNVKACPRRAIYIHYDLSILNIHIRRNTLTWGHTLLIYIKGIRRRDIKSPTRTLLLHHRCKWIQSCEVWRYRQVTFRKRPFETSPTNGLVSRSIDVIYYAHPLQGKHLRVQR